MLVGRMKLSITAAPDAPGFAPLIMRGHMAAAFAAAAGLGCEGVEVHLRHPGDVAPAELRELMRNHRLAVPTLGTGMATEEGLCLAHPDPEVRARTVELVRAFIELASRLGSAVTLGLICFGQQREPARRDEIMRHAVEGVKACCRKAEHKGVTLLLEALNRYESIGLTTLAGTAALIDSIGSPCLKLLADTFHMNIEEKDLADALRGAQRQLAHVHLADSNREAPGHGHIEMKPVIEALKAIGYEGYLSFEILPLPDPQTAARDAVQNTRAVLRSL
jgi:sugar phosphate isomerase/epimerase